MKNIILLLVLLSATIITSCDRCDSGIDCCNPETSKLRISQYLNDWFPYQSDDSIKLTSQNMSNLKFNIDNLIEKDTGYFQGDECPDRPGEFKSGQITSQDDTLFFTTTYDVNSIFVEIDKIRFSISDFTNGRQVNADSLTTIVQMKVSETIINSEFKDLIVAQSDSGNIQKIYLSQGLGLVGIERNDTIYEIKY